MIQSKSISFEVDNVSVKISAANAVVSTEIEVTEEQKNKISYSISRVEENSDLLFDKDKRCPIIFYENRDYWIEFIFEESREIERSEIFHIVSKSRDCKKYVLKFNSKNYVGILNLSIFGVFKSVVEVESKKIDYRTEYDKLLLKISELGIDLVTRASSSFETSTEVSEELERDENFLISKLSYIKSIILSGELEEYYNSFFRKPLSKIVPKKETKYVWEVEDFEIDDYFDSLEKEPVLLANGDKLPLYLDTTYYDDDIDNLENQFIKYLIEYIVQVLRSLLPLVKANKYQILKIEIKECLDRCDSILSNQIFRNISNLRFLPGKSNVLHRRYPYRELYKIYLMMFHQVRIDDSHLYESMKSAQKDLPKLYEYWCFLNIVDVLNSKFGDVDIIEQGLINYNEKSFCYVIKAEGKSLEYKISEKKKLVLYYNRGYSSENYIFEGRSYSHSLNPDISLELFIEDRLVGIVHFDAKYKFERSKSFKSEDLDKMHTYKDAIMGTIGAYILYPGKNTDKYIKEEKGQRVEGDIFPSVGAFVLNNDSCGNSAEMLAINELIDKFIIVDENIESDGIFGREEKRYDYLKRTIG